MSMTVLSPKVVGVTFAPGYPDTILRLHDVLTLRAIDGTHDEPLAVILRRNPDNSHDANAVEVHIPATGQMIGHLDRRTAAYLAPRLDAGEQWAASIKTTLIDPAHPERPGIVVSVTQQSGRRGALLGPRRNDT